MIQYKGQLQKRLRKSDSAKKGWQTRKKRDIELQRRKKEYEKNIRDKQSTLDLEQ